MIEILGYWMRALYPGPAGTAGTFSGKNPEEFLVLRRFVD
jgi:hypothetical protein